MALRPISFTFFARPTFTERPPASAALHGYGNARTDRARDAWDNHSPSRARRGDRAALSHVERCQNCGVAPDALQVGMPVRASSCDYIEKLPGGISLPDSGTRQLSGGSVCGILVCTVYPGAPSRARFTVNGSQYLWAVPNLNSFRSVLKREPHLQRAL